MSVVSYAIKKKKFNPCDTDYLETALLVHKPFDKTRGTERKTKTGGGFIIYAFLLFKQPHILQYIKRVIDSGARTISSICSKLSCFLSENNVSGDIDRVHPFVHLHSISPPVVSSLFFSIPLPVLMQSAPRHSLPVTSTRERTQGKRSTARRQGVKTLIDHLFRTFSPSLLFFFFYCTHAAASSLVSRQRYNFCSSRCPWYTPYAPRSSLENRNEQWRLWAEI